MDGTSLVSHGATFTLADPNWQIVPTNPPAGALFRVASSTDTGLTYTVSRRGAPKLSAGARHRALVAQDEGGRTPHPPTDRAGDDLDGGEGLRIVGPGPSRPRERGRRPLGEPPGRSGPRGGSSRWIRRSFAGIVALSLSMLVLPTQTASAAPTDPITPTLVQTIDTSLFDPGSPDPSGIAYLPASDDLLVVDSEVDETTGAGYHGVNMWEITRAGSVVSTGTTLGYTDEPTGVGHDASTDSIFISSDDQGAIFVRQPGVDGLFGTNDDVNVGQIDTAALGVTDTEDSDFIPGSGQLFFLDGVPATEVYNIDPVNGVFGDGDDVASHFDIGFLGSTDYEGLAYDESRNTLLVGATNGDFIYEITQTGTLVRTIDSGSVSGLIHVSGLTVAPSSTGSGTPTYWIVDRGLDNDSHPTENDGEIFEISVPTDGGNLLPNVNSVTIDQTAPTTDETLTATVDATDGDADPLTLEYQWIKNGTDLPGETSASLNLSSAGNGGRGDEISLRVTAFDGTDTSAPVTSATRTILNAAPIFDQDLPDRDDVEGDAVSFSAGATDPDADILTYSATGLPDGIGIDPDTGEISGTIASGAAGSYPIEVTVRDGVVAVPTPGIELVQVAAARVGGPNATSLTATFPAAPTEGDLLVAFARFAGASTPTLPAGWQTALLTGSSPNGFLMYKVAGAGEPAAVPLVVAPASGSAIVMTILEYAGLSPVQADVLDRTAWDRPTSVQTATIGLADATTRDDELIFAGVSLTSDFPFSGSWTNGFQQRSVIAQQAVADLGVSQTGTYGTSTSWTGASNALAAMATFKGLSPEGEDTLSATDTFTWNVSGPVANAAPVLDPIGNKDAQEGEELAFTATATDADLGDTLTFSLDDGTSGSVPAGASITTGGDFTWTPPDAQPATFDVCVSDGQASDCETITVTVTAAPAPGPLKDDFNGDGRSDLLWRHSGTGENYLWFMNGIALGSHGPTLTLPDTDWKIVGTGDFDGDSKADIVWRNSVTGQVDVWLMNGTNVASSGPVFALSDLDWKLVGTGDFDGDGNADLLWRHATTGENYIWFMDGTTMTSHAATMALPDLGWKVQGTGDFNGDGKTDIAWRNASGQVYVWLMDGTTLTSHGAVFDLADPNWKIQGTGDLNGNGKDDLVWQNSATGEVYVWLMNGTTLSSSGSVFTLADPDWKVVGTGDYDGDGKADLAWRNSTTREVYVWLLNGTTLVSSGSTFVLEPGWEIAPSNPPAGALFRVAPAAADLGPEMTFTVSRRGAPTLSAPDATVRWWHRVKATGPRTRPPTKHEMTWVVTKG